VTAPLFLVAPGQLDGPVPGDALVLEGAEGRHAASVRRIRAGELVDLGDGEGTIARCRVTASGRDHLELELSTIERFPARSLRLVLVQALAKGGRDELAVETATEAGVDRIVPWQAGRSIVRWDGDRGEKARHRWQAATREAAKQSRRAYVPTVEELITTGALTQRVAASALALVLEADAGSNLLDHPLPADGDVLLIVGPEGGIAATELADLENAGAVPVRLGPEVVRTSTAGPLAIAVLAATSGRWS
jgi:16S rRNA (uracil1498-N3)-methyltransferase